MPGILPMKVIKVGNSSQSRIAQACDRCRSKKIRCDGTRPTCTQCSSVGFECRTSDKLSRRAFPRGYTESLEERVRQLETEVHELKDLLDEKDEKIDMLSRIHGNQRRRPSITSDSPSPAAADAKDGHDTKEDTFRVHASPLLLGVENSDSFYMGPSSGRSFIETFKRKIQETGKPCNDINPEAFLHVQGCQSLAANTSDLSSQAPPRLFSDRCVNVYFQEWAPLFPVLHKPSFLRIYEDFVADPEKLKNKHKLAQLHLVFGIAGLSSESPDLQHIASCEKQWTEALEEVLMENTMLTLQCLILAVLYCSVKADYKRLLHYKGIAVGLSHRLGLHQSQKRFSFGALTIETRKRVFWTLYTLDTFTAATLGLPKLLREEDVQTEYPSDTDDEYVTERGFQPTLPGEYTRLSSALALFRGTRILSRVLEKNYPAAPTHELSLQQMSQMENDLNEWYDDLPTHLRLNFVQDKPSTDVTGSRSPLIALAYYYIRTLIYRPAVGSSLGSKTASALMSISTSSKHIIQITQLLEERSMTFSFCLNKGDVLLLCGMTLLYQAIDLKKDSKLMQDDERLVNSVLKTLERVKAPGSLVFRRAASIFISLDEPPKIASPALSSGDSSVASAASNSMPPPSPRESTLATYRKKKSAQNPGRRPEVAASETDLLQQQEKLRRMTMSTVGMRRPELQRSQSGHSTESLAHEDTARYRNHRLSMSQAPRGGQSRSSSTNYSRPNLDYLAFSQTASQSTSSFAQGYMQPPQNVTSPHRRTDLANIKLSGVTNAEWEAMLGSMDGGLNNVYDAIYGGGAGFGNEPATSVTTNGSDWSPDSWDLSSFNIGELGSNSGAAQSVLSMSDESLSSGEEVAPSEMGLSAGGSVDYHQQMLPTSCSNGDSFVFDGLESYPI